MITLDHVTKLYRSHGQTVRAVDDVSFHVGEGQLFVLIGPSGSGKTTTMRMINRLESISEGQILVDGRDVRSIDVVELRRRIGYVIQQGGLLPHFTVADNVAIVPRLLGWPKAQRRARAEELLDLVGLPPDLFANRYPRQLSGGQQQRVGVARALAADPPIVLMDEPFGAVDPITRKQLQRELRRIQAEVHKTIVFVTHDIAEAFLLGDRIVLMDEGRLVQEGTPADLLRRPAAPFVSEFIGEERGVLSLSHTDLSEIADPAPAPPPPEALVLPGDLTLLEAGQAVNQRASLNGQEPADGGVWINDASGRPSQFLSYLKLAAALGEMSTGSDDPSAGEGAA